MTVPKRTTRTPPDPELLKLADHLLANYRKPDDSHRTGFVRGGGDLIGENGLLKQLTKMRVERALETELTQHLGFVMPVRCGPRRCIWPSA